MRKIKTIILIIFIGFTLVIGAIHLLFYFFPYPYARFNKYIMKTKLKYEFCTYNIPNNYEFVEFYDSGRYENALVIWKEKASQQGILLFRFRQQLKLEPGDISFSKKPIKRTFKVEDRRLSENIVLSNFIPFFIDNYPMNTPPLLEVRGFDQIYQSVNLSTESTDVFYVEGAFSNVGLYKNHKGIFKYITHIFGFGKKVDGVFALIRNKKTGDAIFSIFYKPKNSSFDSQMLINFLKSVKFATEPFNDKFNIFRHRHRYIYN